MHRKELRGVSEVFSPCGSLCCHLVCKHNNIPEGVSGMPELCQGLTQFYPVPAVIQQQLHKCIAQGLLRDHLFGSASFYLLYAGSFD